MIHRRTAFSILAVSALAAGCNKTTQPASSPVQTAALSFQAIGQMDKYNCWEQWADFDGDGIYNDTGQLYCEELFDQGGNPAQAQVPIPWHYSLAITVIRAGETEEKLIAASIIPGDSIEDFVSMTGYDPSRDAGGVKPGDGTYLYITPGATTPNSFSSAVVTNGSRLWLEGNGFQLGEPNVLMQSPTFNVNLNQGDTIIVRARKQKLSDAPAFIPANASTQIELSGILTVAGVNVPLQGTAGSPGDDATGVTFSYTRR
ncbi:MAG TPA: hypothetical protein VFV19_14225 [Candidatus Polarisedimenticolaceae bacterium]|nr:hypothetical protein [Candidatus Polarisedimenticolaceae bacterium]